MYSRCYCHICKSHGGLAADTFSAAASVIAPGVRVAQGNSLRSAAWLAQLGERWSHVLLSW